jgi:hypothetical protein
MGGSWSYGTSNSGFFEVQVMFYDCNILSFTGVATCEV